MEHNDPNDTFEQGQSSGAPGGSRNGDPGSFGRAAEAGGTSGGTSDSAAQRDGGASQAGGTSRPDPNGAAGIIGQRQSQSYQQTQQQAKERLGQARDKAVDIKHSVESSLAERLEQGAQRLRARRNAARNAVAGSGAVDPRTMRDPGMGGAAYAGQEGMSAISAQRTDKLETSVARGMEKTADWLRDGDLRTTVEQEVRKNPARSVAIALGLGYLLGKMFKNR